MPMGPIQSFHGANFSKTTDTRVRVLVNNFLAEIQCFYDFVYRNVGHWNFMVLEYSSTFAESKKQVMHSIK